MSRARVLVIDDESKLAQACVDALREADFEASSVSEGHEALAALEVGDLPDLILLDVMLPPMNAEEFRRRQLSDPRLASVRTCATPPRCSGADEISESTEALLRDMAISSWICRPFRDMDSVVRYVEVELGLG